MKRSRGNILFLILLAVVLFAALAYAVTSSMRGGGKDISDEKATTIAAEIINKIALQEVELARFMERTNLKIHQVDFIGPSGTSNNTGNSPNCTNVSCDLWNAAGGGVTAPILPLSAFDPATTNPACQMGGAYRTANGEIRPYMMLISIPGVGTEATDLALYYQCLTPKICAEINIREGIRQKGDPVVLGPITGGGSGNYSNLTQNPANGLNDTNDNYSFGAETRLMSRRLFCDETADAWGTKLIAIIYAQ